jgi:maleylacetate reductase
MTSTLATIPMSFLHEAPPTRVVFAPGSLARVPDEVDRLGAHRVLLVSGGPEAAHAERLIGDLGSRLAGRFGEVVMHVPVEVAGRAVEAARGCAADLIIALGGGSSTGVAKAIAKETGLRILAVPTTYAGSEMTSIWGLTEAARKTTGRDPRVLPVTVVYDPELTLTLPVDISASSGMNAMAHLVEGLYAPGVSPVSQLLAAEGVRALAAALPAVVRTPDDLAARSEALYGAWLAGWTLGTTGMGIHHKVCHVLGGAFDLPHSGVHSAVLPYATAYNSADAPEAMALIEQALTAAGRPAAPAAAGLWDLTHDIGAPTSLAAVGFDQTAIDEVADLIVSATVTNPRLPTGSEVRALLSQATLGDRP